MGKRQRAWLRSSPLTEITTLTSTFLISMISMIKNGKVVRITSVSSENDSLLAAENITK